MQNSEIKPTWPEAFQNVMFRLIDSIPELMIGTVVLALLFFG
ncbi:hypothetical protein [Vibrio sp. DW001]|nr:hypothetical protein [Vibrio sp. DW001]